VVLRATLVGALVLFALKQQNVRKVILTPPRNYKEEHWADWKKYIEK
jgi:hypothetical protein